MSWLNFNDSLNNIKGQISSFASGVLTDVNESGLSENGSGNEELEGLVTSQALEIESLRKQNDELYQRLKQISQNEAKPTGEKNQNDDWSWDSPSQTQTQVENPEIVSTLKKQIENLEEEKRELEVSLTQLDLDCQQTTEKIVNLKDALQTDYNNLKVEHERLQEEHRNLSQKSQTTEELAFIVAERDRLLAENDEFNRKIEECERSHLIDREEYKKLALILQGYEEQVKNYKNQYQVLKSENEDLIKREQGDVKAQKETMHVKYVNLVADTFKKFMDYPLPVDRRNAAHENQFSEFIAMIEVILKILLDLKWKTETLVKEVDDLTQEKTKILTEKNYEIEKLLRNSEILSQEVITKSQSLKHYESECSELMKNNDLLITELEAYKSNSGLQTISESNEDNLLLLESQLDSANKQIRELELTISDLESMKQDSNVEMQIELDYIKRQLNLTGTELSESKIKYRELLAEHRKLSDELAESRGSYDRMVCEKRDLSGTIDKMQSEFENTEFKYSEMNLSMEALTEETETLKSEIDGLTKSKKKLEMLNLNHENKYELLQNELEDLKQELTVEIEARERQDVEIRNLTEKLRNAKMLETGLKLQFDTVSKELQNANEAKVNLAAKLGACAKSEDDLKKLAEENEKYKDEINLLKQRKLDEDKLSLEYEAKLNELKASREEVDSLRAQLEESNKSIAHRTLMTTEYSQKIAALEAHVNELTTSRDDLINLVTKKHHESVQYHGEIQRLNQALALETEKSASFEEQLKNLCPPAEANNDDEIERLSDQNNFLREKCEVLARNLLHEQANLQKVIAEKNNAASEKESTMAKELERLRVHLVEIEEMYTKELVQAETKNQEMQAKVNEIEHREKESSTLYTSVNIRTNQQVETLQTQMQLVTNQRDELRKKISDYEDQIGKQAAALGNLQFVLEQFQKDKEKDVYHETERLRRQITAEKQTQQSLLTEISNLKGQLEESKQGLLAASRLSDQVESSKQQVANMKDEVAKLESNLQRSEARCNSLANPADAKVDKMLIKNLIVGFASSSRSFSKDQRQILKLIATVLDFSQQDNEKVNLNKPEQGSWLSSILQPQSHGQALSQESLSQAFVRFLENESKPRQLPNLLDTADSNLGSADQSGKQAPIVLSEIVLPTFADFGQNRSSSSILKDVLKDNN